MGYLDTSVVVIFGGSSGIGKECALLFAKHGGQIILIARRQAELEEVVNEIRHQNGKAEAFIADVTNPDVLHNVAGAIKDKYGKLDVLIYSAGAFHLSPAETLDIQIARKVMDVNYWSALHVTQVFLPLLRTGSQKSLVFISSLSVPCTPAFFTAYAAPKHALHGFTLALRQELAPDGIHVAEVYPGPVYTPLIEEHIHQAMYRVPPGIPVINPETVAKGVFKTIMKRRKELVIPKRLSVIARLSSAFPCLIGSYYRLSIRGWTKGLQVADRKVNGADSETVPPAEPEFLEP
ncbi:SDR family NAD(P)-dependent oxidoreductase [Alicyclobacillus dauci]|uniref:SDR family NAD(P)-dependent oxidoreductase n=1 Tax=Alicyclobacillus dauci TaxID=1475485 RepID=A0ABY6Z4B4_9BACL|nr:SDR family NAD(P)-dependent oxidoreductase [Alicyclobacillus dauci]WAH37507.1 SDR family NAD(P)-dependent oxidoreductase [Alicyclobacillus dauci]